MHFRAFFSSVFEMNTESTSQNVYSMCLSMSVVSHNYSWGCTALSCVKALSYNYSWCHMTFSFDRYFKYFIPHIGHKCLHAWCKKYGALPRCWQSYSQVNRWHLWNVCVQRSFITGGFLDLWRGGLMLMWNMTWSDADKLNITNTIHPYCQCVNRLGWLYLWLNNFFIKMGNTVVWGPILTINW